VRAGPTALSHHHIRRSSLRCAGRIPAIAGGSCGLRTVLEPTGLSGPRLDLGPRPHEHAADRRDRLRERLVPPAPVWTVSTYARSMNEDSVPPVMGVRMGDGLPDHLHRCWAVGTPTRLRRRHPHRRQQDAFSLAFHRSLRRERAASGPRLRSGGVARQGCPSRRSTIRSRWTDQR
jgi:hypothetical protein